ncbi:MAG: ABC transporter permease [Alphaproteobacteria bacterium]|jgi:NitT/TauT family transport system permease protein|nr:ABC transporter permease [Alphaproteobacteria bacterium]
MPGLVTVPASLLALVLLWALLAVFTDPEILPPPLAVLALAAEEWHSGDLLFHLGATLGRVLTAFILAMAIGAAIGIALGLSGKANRAFDPWLIVALNIPALVTIVLCYLWFGLTEVAAIAAVAVNKIPNVAVTLREGARALDRELAEMARLYRFGPAATLRHVILPQLAPFMTAAARSGIALIWKIVLVVELLGRSNGVGFQIHLYFQLFDIGRIFVYAIAFILVMQAVELGILQPWERHASRWRRV